MYILVSMGNFNLLSGSLEINRAENETDFYHCHQSQPWSPWGPKQTAAICHGLDNIWNATLTWVSRALGLSGKPTQLAGSTYTKHQLNEINLWVNTQESLHVHDGMVRHMHDQSTWCQVASKVNPICPPSRQPLDKHVLERMENQTVTYITLHYIHYLIWIWFDGYWYGQGYWTPYRDLKSDKMRLLQKHHKDMKTNHKETCNICLRFWEICGISQRFTIFHKI